uniref:Alpha-mannosidase n=1 Tax=Nilaparvata lugens TaxID=108931 RepID=A0A1I9WL33_NILLU|nr:seminal fluid protein [Nilaparvata lugens]
MLVVSALVCLLVFDFNFSKKLVSAQDDCGYVGCHPTRKGKLNVHLVAHTHDDVGWLKTVDQYYYGSNKVHSPFGVQYILDSVISELLKKKDRRFVYVESSFLWRWWTEQDEDLREEVQTLVREGRLQLLHGGWCMSDEATPHYSALIDQMTLGLKFLNDTFGECALPRVAWQIDPFGHSSEVALQFAQMGYDGLFFGRLDYQDYAQRKYTKNMETVWRPDTKLGEMGDLFTGVLYNLYMPPDGFCFDTYCSDEPLMDNPKLHGYNVNGRIAQFVKAAESWAEAYKTHHVMITMGGDFNYIVASSWFKNMDKLIKYINQKYKDVNVLYSTPACYLKAVHAENITWPVKDDDDFMPYGSDEHSYWTGYYTSRPNLKYLVYKGNNFLQVCRQLRVALGGGLEMEEEELTMARAMADAQHHDAVSGTEKQHVADDYTLYLSEGFQSCNKVLTAAYRKLLGSSLKEQHFCLWSNISACSVSEGASKFAVNVYNPLAQVDSTYVRIPVFLGDYKVTGPTGQEVPSELVPLPKPVQLIPGRKANATVELLFEADNISQLGLKSYHIERLGSGDSSKVDVQEYNMTFNATEDVVVDNGVLQLIFNGSTGLLEYVTKDNETWLFRQNFYYYEASKGYNYNSDNRASGAYIFRPAKETTYLISEQVQISVFKGKEVTEVHQVFDTWLSQIVRIYKNQDQIEFQWLVGPIPVEKWTGKEVITKYKTTLQTNGELWTDSNGRRMIKRKRNYRSSWNLTLTEPVASNYYPITSAAAIKDDQRRVTVLVDRAQGAASLQDGEIEIMVHRRLLYDDNKGVSEPLDEIQFGEGLVTRGTHIVQLTRSENAATPSHSSTHRIHGSPVANEHSATQQDQPISDVVFSEGAEKHRTAANRIVNSPWLSFYRTHKTATEWLSSHKTQYNGILKNPLPSNVNLLTLQWWSANSFLVRFEHMYDVNEHQTLSQPVTFNCSDFFSDFTITKAVELNLSASKEKQNMSRLRWRHEGPITKTNQPDNKPLDESLTVTLNPMEIRTFRLYVTRKTT